MEMSSYRPPGPIAHPLFTVYLGTSLPLVCNIITNRNFKIFWYIFVRLDGGVIVMDRVDVLSLEWYQSVF